MRVSGDHGREWQGDLHDESVALDRVVPLYGASQLVGCAKESSTLWGKYSAGCSSCSEGGEGKHGDGERLTKDLA